MCFHSLTPFKCPQTSHPFQLLARIAGDLDKLITIHSVFPRATKHSKGVMSKLIALAIVKRGRKVKSDLAKLEKQAVKIIANFGQHLAPRAKEVRDSIRILKAVMKSDFPEAYKKIWGKKKPKGRGKK